MDTGGMMNIFSVSPHQTVEIDFVEFEGILITVCVPVAEDDCDSTQAKRDTMARAIGDAMRTAIDESVVLTAGSYQAAASAVSSAEDGTLWDVSVISAERDVAVVTFVTREPKSLMREALSRGWSA